MKALVQEEYAKPLIVKNLPVPQPTPGSAVLQILSAPIVSYMREVYNGARNYAYFTPLTIGTGAIGRVAAVGPDAALLKPGQLVIFDCAIRARDDPGAIILSGLSEGGTEGSRKLMRGEWREGSFAEYAKVPLENAFPLNEARLMGNPKSEGGLGYSIDELGYMQALLVPFGGLRDIRLEAGETVIVAPATGGFGGAAVLVALAMGARVIAMGRNVKALEGLKKLSPGPGRLETVPITGSVDDEVAALTRFGRADAYFDISPREAQSSTHVKSAILSLRHGGRVSLMGGFLEDLPIPHRFVMRFDIKMHGKWMCSRNDIALLVKMVEIGLLRLDERANVKIVGEFKLEQWKEAFDVAWENARQGQIAVFKP
jgi:D-arabinose 1-dehydrogenase-like Zn-dependent alcohol dehydrogenase